MFAALQKPESVSNVGSETDLQLQREGTVVQERIIYDLAVSMSIICFLWLNLHCTSDLCFYFLTFFFPLSLFSDKGCSCLGNKLEKQIKNVPLPHSLTSLQ